MKFDTLPSFTKFMITAYLAKEMNQNNQKLSNSVRDSGEVNMNFSINGIVIDPIVFFDRLEQAFDDEVTRKAYELMQDKCNTTLQAFDDYHYLRKQLDKKLCEALDIPMEED